MYNEVAGMIRVWNTFDCKLDQIFLPSAGVPEIQVELPSSS